MQRVNIDFVVRPLWQQPLAARSRAILVVLAGVLVLAGAALAWQVLGLDRQLGETAQAMALARRELAARTPPPQYRYCPTTVP